MMGVAGLDKNRSKFGPGVRGGHIHNPYGLNARLRRIDPEQGGGLASFDAAPEFRLCGDNEMLVKRIGVGLDFNPSTAAGDDRKNRGPCSDDEHVVLQLSCVLL